jgi:hypothetical protein
MDPERTLDLVACPGCEAPAEVLWVREVSSDPAGRLARVTCLSRHWFLLPENLLRSLVVRDAGPRPLLAADRFAAADAGHQVDGRLLGRGVQLGAQDVAEPPELP